MKPRERLSRMPAPGNAYHHGDLRAALIAAADDELAENGLHGFTLRGCARRAGVSHAAPAHHFKDVRGLLSEVAANGLERLAETTERFGRNAPKGTIEHIAEAARGYVTFAAQYPHHFRLIFNSERYDRTNPRTRAAGAAAFSVPVEAIGSYRGSTDPMSDPALIPQVIGLWSIVHGFSDLMLLGQLDSRPGVARQSLIDTLMPTMIRQFFEVSQLAGSPRPRKRSRGKAPN